jgi:hypothetical protein
VHVSSILLAKAQLQIPFPPVGVSPTGMTVTGR